MQYRLCNRTQRPVSSQNQIPVQSDEKASDLFRLRHPGGTAAFLYPSERAARQRSGTHHDRGHDALLSIRHV